MNWCNGVIEIKRISFWELNIKCEGRWQTYKKGDIYLLNILKLSTQHWIILIFQRDIGFFSITEFYNPRKVCYQPKVPGPCRGSIPRWWYNKRTGRCQKFIYGGCKGNSNNFTSKLACLRRCGRTTRRKSRFTQSETWQAWFVWKYAMLYRSGFISYFNDNCLFTVLLTCIFTWVYE